MTNVTVSFPKTASDQIKGRVLDLVKTTVEGAIGRRPVEIKESEIVSSTGVEVTLLDIGNLSAKKASFLMEMLDLAVFSVVGVLMDVNITMHTALTSHRKAAAR